MKVYVVVGHEDSCSPYHGNYAVFSTKEKAEEFGKANEGHVLHTDPGLFWEYTIDEFEIDVPPDAQ